MTMIDVTPEQTAEDLLAAIPVLRRLGWTKGTFYEPGQGCCMTGAVRIAIGDIIPVDDPEIGYEVSGDAALMHRYLFARVALMRVSRVGPIGWNDVVAKDIEQVIAKLDEAAEAVLAR